MNANFRGLHVLADDDARWKHDPVAQAEAACRGGAQVIQLRAKSTPDTRALEWARKIRALTRACGALFVVNDRFDLALEAEADGVHLGQEDLSPLSIPAEARSRLAIGRSTHTMEQIASARSEPVDYLAFGPVFGTESKISKYGPRGLDRLRQAARMAAPRPLVAIGGIDATNLGDVIRNGAQGIAVISAVAGTPDPQAATRQFVSVLADIQGSPLRE